MTAKGRPTVLRNYFSNTLLTAVNFLFPLITYPWVNRILGPAKIGAVNWVASVVSYFVMIATLGIPIYGMREIAKAHDDLEKRKAVLNLLLSASILMAVACTAALVCLVLAVPAFRAYAGLFFVSGSLVLVNAFSVDWYFQGMERYGYITLRSIGVKLAMLAAMFLLVRKETDYVNYAAIIVIGSGGSNLLNFASLAREKAFSRLKFSVSRLLAVVRGTGKLFLMGLAISIYTSANIIILGYLAPKEEVGFFSTAYRILQLCMSFMSSLVVVLLPRMTRSGESGNAAEFAGSIRPGIGALLRLLYPMLGGLLLLAPQVIGVIGGERYAASVGILYVLAPIVIVSGVSNFLTNLVFISRGREGEVIAAAGVGGAVSLVLDFILIPRMGGFGAGIAYLGAEGAILLYYCLRTEKAVMEVILKGFWGKHLWATLLMCVGVFFVRKVSGNALVSVLAATCAGTIAYAGIMVFLLKDPYAMRLKASFAAVLARIGPRGRSEPR